MSLKEIVAKSLPKPIKVILKRILAAVGILDQKNAQSGRSTLTAEDLNFWNENGYLVLKSFFDPQQVEKISSVVDQTWASRAKDPNNPLVADIFIGTEREKRILLKDAPDDAKQLPYKLNDLFLESEEVRNLILNSELCEILQTLLGGEPMVCNSLSFERGSQQFLHFDTFYMPPLVPNKMLATWIAVENCSLDAGPLTYYPGSHKIEPYRFSHGRLHAVAEEMSLWQAYIQQELEKHNLKPQTFAAKSGDVFIWHAQLLHGGSEIKDMSLTRKSLVTHYFRINEHPGDYISVGKGHYMRRGHQNVPAQ